MRHRAAAVLVVGALLTAGCVPGRAPDPPPPTTAVAEKQGDGRLRTDLDPLTSRFAELGTPVRASWMSGTMGSDRVPGPSTYWIDAVVEVTPEVMAELAATKPAVTSERPDVVARVAEAIPAGTLRTSPELNALFASERWWVDTYLVEGANTVVLVAKGE